LFESKEKKHTHLSDVQRGSIVGFHLDSQPRNIIAKKINTSIKSVQRWIRKYTNKQNIKDEPRSGRPKTTTNEQEENIINIAQENKFITPKQIKNKLELNISTRTIDRRLVDVKILYWNH
jgi:transposase